MKRRKVVFIHNRAPGDIAVMTAAIRDLHKTYPGQFYTDVRTTPGLNVLWENNPYLTPLDPVKENTIHLEYGDQLRESNYKGMHFIWGFMDFINRMLGVQIKMTALKPDIHLSEHSKETAWMSGSYWVIMSGGKIDITTKWWDPERLHEVVDFFRGKISFVQVGGAKSWDVHPPIDCENVTSVVGETSLEGLLNIIYHSQGVICPVTCAMHFAAAFNKPCVVIAGGREHWTWEAYNKETLRRNMSRSNPGADIEQMLDEMVEHKYLHTAGQLPCCREGGCWKGLLEPSPEPKLRGRGLCTNQVQTKSGRKLPRCMSMITADMVIEAVMSYFGETPLFAKSHKEDLLTGDETIVIDERQAIVIPDSPHAQSDKPQLLVESKPVKLRNVYKAVKPPLTICVCAYGTGKMEKPLKTLTDDGKKKTVTHYHELHTRCINSIIKNTAFTVDRTRMYKLVVGLNEADEKTKRFLLHQVKPFVEDLVLVEHDKNIMKYPMMREMFECVRTDWVVWFDDDSHLMKKSWLTNLCRRIEKDEANKSYVAMYGRKAVHSLTNEQLLWIQHADWYRGKLPLVDSGGMPFTVFILGGWWAMRTKVIRELDWPDERIYHNGGDVMLGEALRQADWRVGNHYDGVVIDDAPRRGYSERHAGVGYDPESDEGFDPVQPEGPGVLREPAAEVQGGAAVAVQKAGLGQDQPAEELPAMQEEHVAQGEEEPGDRGGGALPGDRENPRKGQRLHPLGQAILRRRRSDFQG